MQQQSMRRVESPQIVVLDLETVPDPCLLARAMAEPEVDPETIRQAYRLAEIGDVDAMKELLGDDFRPGNAKKPDALCKAVQAYESGGEARRDRKLARLGMEPTTLAICSFAIYTTETDEHGQPLRQAIVGSWGTTVARETTLEDGVQLFTVPTVEEAKPLVEMSTVEQLIAERRLLLGLWSLLGQMAEAFGDGRAILATYNGMGFDLRALLWRSMRHRQPLTTPAGDLLPGVSPTVRLDTPRYQTRPHLDVMQVVAGWERQNWCRLPEALARMGIAYQKHDSMDGSKVYPYACEGRWADIETYNLGDVVDLHAGATMLVEGGLA